MPEHEELMSAGQYSSLQGFEKLLKASRNSPDDIGWLALGATFDREGLQDGKMSRFINFVVKRKYTDFISAVYAGQYSSLADFGRLLETFKDWPKVIEGLSEGANKDPRDLRYKKMALVTDLILDKNVTEAGTALHAAKYSSLKDFGRLLETFKNSTVEVFEDTAVIDFLSQGAADDARSLRGEKISCLVNFMLDNKIIGKKSAIIAGQYSSVEDFEKLLETFKGAENFQDIAYRLGHGASHDTWEPRRQKQKILVRHAKTTASALRDGFKRASAEDAPVKRKILPRVHRNSHKPKS